VAVTEVHVLSLGAGVQSTAIYLMALEGRLRLDAAVFADTQEEPAAVYQHLAWLMSKGTHKIPIITRTVGRLGDDIINGRNSTGLPGAGIPAYTREGATGPANGKGKRQCTAEYKIRVIERAIRRDVLGLKPRQRVPKGVTVHQHIGISLDEARRSLNLRKRFAEKERLGDVHFPLLDLGWTRSDCERFNADRVPHPVTRSACVFCPLKNDREWLRLRETDPSGWARAVEIDKALRGSAAIAGRLRGQLYLHDSAKPLDQATFRSEGQGEFPGFVRECEGACGV
jgi:hypothetical protein